MVIGKRHFALAALAVALGAAVYLNWQFAPSEELVKEASSGYVEYEDNMMASADIITSQSDGAVEAARKTNFFESARSDRTTAHADAADALTELINDPAISEASKTEAVASMAKLAENTEKEAAIETLVKAKGYSDCVVVISDNQVNVIIPASASGLTAADAAVVRDIVMGQTELSASSVKIIEAK